MKEIIRKALQYTFGNNNKTFSYDIIADGYKNIALKIQCNHYDKPIFMKIEKDFDIPRIQKNQIKREITGIRLCQEKNINVPKLINSDDTGLIFGKPWIFEEFINGKLIGQCIIEKENRHRLGIEFEDIFAQLLSIESDYYGDTFENGLIGNQKSWIETLTKMTLLLLEDCDRTNVFHDSEHTIIEQALSKALSSIKCNSKPVFYHYDLFSQNIFAEEGNNEFHLGSIIDFGMSMFAPIHFVQHQTRKLTDFEMKDVDVCDVYGIDENELIAYDILRLEPILLLHHMKNNDRKAEDISETDLYVDKCIKYLNN